MEYQQVFDILQAGYRYWWFPAAGLASVVVGAFLFRFRNREGSRWRTRIFPFVFLTFACMWTVVSFWETFGDYLELRNALLENRCEVTEGTIVGFLPMPREGHADEYFTVNGLTFAYSDYTVMAGFNNTRSHGGPIQKGLRVRVHHYQGQIARLEVAK